MMRALAAAVLAIAFLAACGQKGPLVIPQENAPQSQLNR